MHLYFNGDSNMSGEEIVEGDTISSKVSERLGATKIVNHALSGASNDYIYRTTTEYLTLNTPDFVLIGVTEMGRGEWLLPWNDGLEYIDIRKDINNKEDVNKTNSVRISKFTLFRKDQFIKFLRKNYSNVEILNSRVGNGHFFTTYKILKKDTK